MKKLLLIFSAATLLSGCDRPATATKDAAAAAPAPLAINLPAGTYKTDPAHSSLTFMVNHIGFSNYTGSFAQFDATLNLDPVNPKNAQLTATVRPRSLQLPSPPEGFLAEMTGSKWLDTQAFPQMTYVSKSVEITGANTARVTGDLTLRGVTRPVTMEVIFNGGYPGLAGLDPQARMGFSASGKLNRSDFGIDYGIPAPGSTMGVSDEVRFMIETEMLGPPLKE